MALQRSLGSIISLLAFVALLLFSGWSPAVHAQSSSTSPCGTALIGSLGPSVSTSTVAVVYYTRPAAVSGVAGAMTGNISGLLSSNVTFYFAVLSSTLGVLASTASSNATGEVTLALSPPVSVVQGQQYGLAMFTSSTQPSVVVGVDASNAAVLAVQAVTALVGSTGPAVSSLPSASAQQVSHTSVAVAAGQATSMTANVTGLTRGSSFYLLLLDFTLNSAHRTSATNQTGLVTLPLLISYALSNASSYYLAALTTDGGNVSVAVDSASVPIIAAVGVSCVGTSTTTPPSTPVSVIPANYTQLLGFTGLNFSYSIAAFGSQSESFQATASGFLSVLSVQLVNVSVGASFSLSLNSLSSSSTPYLYQSPFVIVQSTTQTLYFVPVPPLFVSQGASYSLAVTGGPTGIQVASGQRNSFPLQLAAYSTPSVPPGYTRALGQIDQGAFYYNLSYVPSNPALQLRESSYSAAASQQVTALSVQLTAFDPLAVFALFLLDIQQQRVVTTVNVSVVAGQVTYFVPFSSPVDLVSGFGYIVGVEIWHGWVSIAAADATATQLQIAAFALPTPAVPANYSVLLGELGEGGQNLSLSAASSTAARVTATSTPVQSAFASLLAVQLADGQVGSALILSLLDGATGVVLASANVSVSQGPQIYQAAIPPQWLVAGQAYSLTVVCTAGVVTVAAASVSTPASVQVAALYRPQPSTTVGTVATGSVCLLSYALPGTVDYPWSVATSLSFTYSTTPITTSSGSARQLLTATGTRTFLNRFGAASSVSVSLATLGATSASNLLYLGSSTPVDGVGLTLEVGGAVQLPGAGPSHLYSSLTLANVSGTVVELGSSRFDPLGQSYLSSVAGFKNITIGASDINSLAVNYAACQAPITFTNGLRAPTQPSNFNGAVHVSYSYSISDGATYTVVANLSLTLNSAFATTSDQLGNPYQTVVGISGTRVYTYLTTGAHVTATVTGLSNTSSFLPPASQRFYPYTLLAASPGVYSTSTAPFFDGGGLAFAVSPPVPVNGADPSFSSSSSSLSSSVVLHMSSSMASFTLTESVASASPPMLSLQSQQYSLQ